MGVVYRAEDTRLDRTVALKFLPPHLTADSAAKTRFIHEAKAASSLEHPAICSIFEIDETEDGKTFMVMPCYEGQTLAERLEEGPMAVDQAMEIFRQTAQGLAKAHSQGIVHRDIKPANIFLTEDGQAKILDFGLAKLAGQTKLTQEGTTLGTVAYMSPEQARGEAVTEQSDIWSLGAVLYEMLGGKPAFGGENPHAVMYAIQQIDPAPLSETRSDIPAGALSLVAGMLEKDPALRLGWQAGQLAEILGEPGMFRAMTRSKPWYRRGPGVAAGLAVVLVALLLIIQPWKTGGAITAIAVLPFENLSGDEKQEYYADGMTGQLISKLGALRIFDRVISRRSVMQYKGESMDLAQIGSDLGVQAIVEGSVMLLDDRVQVTAFLLDAARDRQLWTDTFDEPVANIMDIQRQIVMAIARAVRLELDPAAQERLRNMGTVDPEAHKACMRGYEWLNDQTSKEENELAVRYFEDSITADSTYALAWAGLGEALTQLTHYDEAPTTEHLERTRDAINRALELDPDLAEAHWTNGHFLWEHQFEMDAADRAFQKGRDLNPNLAMQQLIYSYYLQSMGRYDEGAAVVKKAIDLDPNSLWIQLTIFFPLTLAGRYDQALDQIEQVKRNFPGNYSWVGPAWTVHADQGDWKAALALLDSIPPADRNEFHVQRKITTLIYLERPEEALELFEKTRAQAEADSNYFSLAISAAKLGLKDAAKTYIAKYKEGSPSDFFVAYLHCLLGEKDEALALLEDAYEKKVNWVTRLGWMSKQPDWSILRDDPRFVELLEKIGIPL